MNKFTIGDGCWLWTASLNDSGYGQVNPGGRGNPLRAHRVLYEALVGPIPKGMTIDHLCRNRSCVRPDHMEIVTRAENVRRGVGGQMTHLRALAKTHCKRGHLLVGAPLQRLRNGYFARRCRPCAALRARGYRRVSIRA